MVKTAAERRTGIGVADGRATPGQPGTSEPFIDTSDLAILQRAFSAGDPPAVPPPTTVRPGILTVARSFPTDFQDRSIELFVDDHSWGKVAYGHELSREIAPGRHRVRAWNTLFSQTMEVDVMPGEHVRLRCGNGFPRAGYLMMFFFQVTYLKVRLERDAGAA